GRNVFFGIALPGGAATELGGSQALFAKLGEVVLPACIERIGIRLPGCVHLLHKGGVGTVEKGGRFENVVRSAVQPVGGRLLSHLRCLWGGLLGLGPSWWRVGW